MDFRNPENFFHDVNSVAGLLKQFFRDLPDPLFTRELYRSFIEAAREFLEVASFNLALTTFPQGLMTTLPGEIHYMRSSTVSLILITLPYGP